MFIVAEQNCDICQMDIAAAYLQVCGLDREVIIEHPNEVKDHTVC